MPDAIHRQLRCLFCTLAIAALATACGTADRPADAVLFGEAIARLRDELELRDTLYVHPFPLLRGAPGPAERPTEQRFNSSDSASVPAFVARARDTRVRLCTIGRAGSCELAPGATAVVVSEPFALAPEEVGIDLIVTDRRAGRSPRAHYRARLKGGASRWSVVALERAP